MRKRVAAALLLLSSNVPAEGMLIGYEWDHVGYYFRENLNYQFEYKHKRNPWVRIDTGDIQEVEFWLDVEDGDVLRVRARTQWLDEFGKVIRQSKWTRTYRQRINRPVEPYDIRRLQ